MLPVPASSRKGDAKALFVITRGAIPTSFDPMRAVTMNSRRSWLKWLHHECSHSHVRNSESERLEARSSVHSARSDANVVSSDTTVMFSASMLVFDYRKRRHHSPSRRERKASPR